MAYTTIDDPSTHFYAYAFSKSSGTGSATFDGNSDLQPDFLWVKSRTNADSHELWDSTRGVSSTLFADVNEAADPSDNRLVSFNTDGFTWGNAGNLNAAGNFVSWAWKANAGSTSSNTSGTLTSTIQSDTTAGFCIATYTGNGTTGATYGHNLGVAPDIMFTKNLTSNNTNWSVDGSIGDMVYGTNKLILDTNAALGADTNNVTGASSTLITVGNGANCNQNTSSHVAYLFAEKQGYSKFGKYTGNGNADGTFVYTGFKPAFLMIKQTSAANNWVMIDSARDTYNAADATVYADLGNAEENPASSVTGVDLLSNGFKFRDSKSFWNTSGGTYMYMAFARNPFVTSTGIPTTAR